jgi:hypothetical protein
LIAGWIGFTLLKALCDDAQSQGFSLDNGFVLGCAVGQYARQFNDFSQFASARKLVAAYFSLDCLAKCCIDP